MLPCRARLYLPQHADKTLRALIYAELLEQVAPELVRQSVLSLPDLRDRIARHEQRFRCEQVIVPAEMDRSRSATTSAVNWNSLLTASPRHEGNWQSGNSPSFASGSEPSSRILPNALRPKWITPVSRRSADETVTAVQKLGECLAIAMWSWTSCCDGARLP